MECHEGATMIKTYRGMLSDDSQDKIRLKTNKGDVGYRIVKFQIIGHNPGLGAQDSVMKIYKTQQTSVDGLVDFTEGDLLGVAFWTTHEAGSASTGEPPIVIFEQEVFNQDIYVTHEDHSANQQRCNYYLELEQVALNENESTMATLQSLRQIAER